MRWSGKVAAIAAGATQANILAGRIGNPPSRPSAMQMAAVASQPGVRATLVVGTEVLLNDEELSPANRFPNLKDDIVTPTTGVQPAEAVSLTFRNTAGTASDVFYLVDIVPVG